jgi:hypothetical protein
MALISKDQGGMTVNPSCDRNKKQIITGTAAEWLQVQHHFNNFVSIYRQRPGRPAIANLLP